ncbi:MAG: hypothetical protein J5764_04355 [Bacteroidales bacterium]|nr:hypothetical protein [Bacteroidales bacterium]
MKKLLLVIAAVLGLAVVAAAQPRAIGVRAGYGAELSYQHTLGGNNFGELDLGWSWGAFSAGLSYDFSVAPVGPLNFYAGPQVALGFYKGDGASVFSLGAGAQLGLEYCFNQIPLQLSLDWKPTFVFVPATGFGWQSIALGIRYLF